MELTKEMVYCIKQQFTIIDGWEIDCTRCRLFAKDQIRRQDGICTIYKQCYKWAKEQERNFLNDRS